MSFLVEIVMKHHVHDVINIIVIRGKSSVRPSYDGVLLLSHIRESIPILLRAVKNHSLQGRFRSVVAGMGDISAYLADHHRQKFYAENNQIDLGLFNVFAKVNGYRADKRSTCEQRATHSYEILRELLGEKPNYREVQLVLL